MQAYQFLSMKIRKLAFGKICHMDCSTDIILEEKKKRQSYSNILWNTQFTKNSFLQNPKETTRRSCTRTLSF